MKTFKKLLYLAEKRSSTPDEHPQAWLYETVSKYTAIIETHTDTRKRNFMLCSLLTNLCNLSINEGIDRVFEKLRELI